MFARLSIIALLAAVSCVTAKECAIVGPGNAWCRSHPDPSASVVKELSIGTINDYGCRYPYGVSVDGDR